ncbi:hypothetical protein OsJ_05995 [Oryza sativa Japonica Group]|uniref:Uncharacterized protein n=1 Tax=Oryza sativa subsp. japonica TaxID=39947 RepID=A3A4V2_ORYSJ|nr:hypothetical protein OsJ_05995 [Oryza sativa Japonica Group]
MAGGDNNSQTTNGGSGHEQRAMEEGRKQEEFAADGQGCGLAFSVPFIQKIIAEIFGTYFLIFAGCGAVTINQSKNGQITFPGVAIVWGLAVMVMVYAVGHISGAHFNPAVTLAFATCRRFPWRQSLVLEFIITFYLMFVISGVATDNRAIGELAGLAVGATILLNVLIAGPISGASMNPARSLGPAMIGGEYRSIWVYIVGPVAGAVAGAWAYNIIRFTNKPLREITKSGSFLKSMNRMNSST